MRKRFWIWLTCFSFTQSSKHMTRHNGYHFANCLPKVRFSSQQACVVNIATTYPKKATELTTYLCEFCHYWHKTSRRTDEAGPAIECKQLTRVDAAALHNYAETSNSIDGDSQLHK